MPEEPPRSPRDYPAMAAAVRRVEPAPRRVRGYAAGAQVFDTVRARYGWEWPYYPQYYVPLADVTPGVLVDDGHQERLPLGPARRQTLRIGGTERTQAAYVLDDEPPEGEPGFGVGGTVRFTWDALDAWFEEDEQIFVHPRNPYVRVDALRSHRHVRVELDGVLLAESHQPVLLFETGLPTRYYLDRSDVRFEHLVPSETRTPCPYKGRTSAYWSVALGDAVHADLAWCYDYPTGGALPVAGMVCFYNERVDITVDGVPLVRPTTHF